MARPARRPSGRPWRPIGRALAWGVVLTLIQWGVEQTTFVAWLTEGLARLLVLFASEGFGISARLDGLVIEVGGDRQAILPGCLGLIAFTAYLTGLLAVPADWTCRWRGIRRDLPLLIFANGFRLSVLVALGAISTSAVHLAHVVILVAVAPLVVMGLWGFWLTRDLQVLHHYPWRFVRLVALTLLPAIGLWWVLLHPYLVVLVAATKRILIGLFGLPIGSAALVEDGLGRFLELTVPEGRLRLEVAARSLSLAPYLALVAASPPPWARRIWLGSLGVALIFVLHAVEATSFILLGRTAPALVPPAEALSVFLTLATGPLMWFLLAAPSAAWWVPAKSTRRLLAP